MKVKLELVAPDMPNGFRLLAKTIAIKAGDLVWRNSYSTWQYAAGKIGDKQGVGLDGYFWFACRKISRKPSKGK